MKNMFELVGKCLDNALTRSRQKKSVFDQRCDAKKLNYILYGHNETSPETFSSSLLVFISSVDLQIYSLMRFESTV
jgi:hypothetical protein